MCEDDHANEDRAHAPKSSVSDELTGAGRSRCLTNPTRGDRGMSLPDVVSRDQWLAARKELLAKEKELTRARDALNAERRMLPMVEIEKPYAFEGPPRARQRCSTSSRGAAELILIHFMFDPEWEDGCASCTAGADEMAPGLIAHLHARETSLAYVGRAPLAKIERYKAKRGWTFPFYSSFGSDFNYDFHVTLDESVAPVEYNYRTPRGAPAGGHVVLRRGRPAASTARPEPLPARRRSRLPHVLDLRARRRDDGWLVLLPGPQCPGAPGGMGGAEGPRGRPARRDAGLRDPLGERERQGARDRDDQQRGDDPQGVGAPLARGRGGARRSPRPR